METLKKVLYAVDVTCLAATMATHNVCFAVGALVSAVVALAITITDRGK